MPRVQPQIQQKSERTYFHVVLLEICMQELRVHKDVLIHSRWDN
jgi:hypothetical protein